MLILFISTKLFSENYSFHVENDPTHSAGRNWEDYKG
jgi:hypothetical protein